MIVEIMTWAQLGRHSKPMVFGNIGGFWSPMLNLVYHMKAEGFLHSADRVRPLVVDDASAIVPAILKAAETADRAEGEPAVIERM
jgi:predicted Rossmann-fold nucleotide-binding protein